MEYTDLPVIFHIVEGGGLECYLVPITELDRENPDFAAIFD